MFAGTASVSTAAISGPRVAKSSDGGQVAIRDDDGVGGDGGGDSGRVRQAERGHPGAGGDEERSACPW